jgi:hypothetical protein
MASTIRATGGTPSEAATLVTIHQLVAHKAGNRHQISTILYYRTHDTGYESAILSVTATLTTALMASASMDPSRLR